MPEMQAPAVDVLTHEGTRVPLASFFADKPVALIFLRHLGCIFCREQVSELKEAGLNIALVGMATPEEAAEFQKDVGVPHPVICDPNRHLHEAFGLTRGTKAQLINFKTITKGLRAYRAGHRQTKIIGDPFQLPGAFVIGTSGEILWEYRGKDAADHPTAQMIKSALAGAGKAKVGSTG